MLPRLTFLHNFQTESGDRYRAGLTYQVENVVLRDFLVSGRIAYEEGTEPPFDPKTEEEIIEGETQEARFMAQIAKRRKNSLFRRQEFLRKQEERLQEVVERRINRRKEGEE